MARKWFQYIGRSRLLPASFGRSTSVPRNLGKGKGEMKGKNLKFSVECYHPRVFSLKVVAGPDFSRVLGCSCKCLSKRRKRQK